MAIHFTSRYSLQFALSKVVRKCILMLWVFVCGMYVFTCYILGYFVLTPVSNSAMRNKIQAKSATRRMRFLQLFIENHVAKVSAFKCYSPQIITITLTQCNC